MVRTPPCDPESRVVFSVRCRITCLTPCEANLRNQKEYIFSIIKVMTRKYKETSVGSGTHVATDKFRFTSPESNYISNAT
jgi:hypothetical protein